MLNQNKRAFIKNILSVFMATTLGCISKIFAAWPQDLFNEKNSDQAIKLLIDRGEIRESDLITIKAPDIAENGGVVPITVSTQLDNVKNISILIENNPSPLTSSFVINDQLTPYVSTRVKMAKTSNVIAIIATDNGNFRASRNIKVTIGGCGG